MSEDLKVSSAPLAEISQGPNQFEAFLDRNQMGIIVFAILLALGAAGLVVYRGIESGRQTSAGAALSKAEDLATLQAVVDEHADTIAAGSAMVLLANSQWTDGKQDEAVGTLQKFIADSPTHPAIPTAKASLASKLMTQGKSGDAAVIFEQLSTDPAARYIAPYALISLGDMAKDAGDLEKAEPYYVKVTTEFPDSAFAETANKRNAAIKAKPPTEIEAPAEPEKPADPADALKSSLPPGVTITPSPAPTTPAPTTPESTPQVEPPPTSEP